MMLRKAIPLVAAIALTISIFACGNEESSTPQDEQHTLRVGVDPSFKPFEFIDTATGELTGFDIELVKRISTQNGWAIDIREIPFAELLRELEANRIDIAISAITITAEREARVDFSDPYYISGQALTVSGDDTLTRELDDLSGKRVGVLRRSTAEQLAVDIKGSQIFAVGSIDSAFVRLAHGELDAVINDYPSTREFLKLHPDLRLANDYLNVEYYGVAMRKGNREILEELNDALAVLTGGQDYEAMHIKWFGYRPLGEPSPADSMAGQGE